MWYLQWKKWALHVIAKHFIQCSRSSMESTLQNNIVCKYPVISYYEPNTNNLFLPIYNHGWFKVPWLFVLVTFMNFSIIFADVLKEKKLFFSVWKLFFFRESPLVTEKSFCWEFLKVKTKFLESTHLMLKIDWHFEVVTMTWINEGRLGDTCVKHSFASIVLFCKSCFAI